MTIEARSLAAKLAAFFRRHPGEWIDGRALEFAGRYAWRSRIADVRKAPYFLTIRNRQRRLRKSDGGRYVVSEYMFVKTIEAGAAADAEDVRCSV